MNEVAFLSPISIPYCSSSKKNGHLGIGNCFDPDQIIGWLVKNQVITGAVAKTEHACRQTIIFTI